MHALSSDSGFTVLLGQRKLQKCLLCPERCYWLRRFASNIGILLLNKHMLGGYGFKYPVFLTFCHMLACVILSQASMPASIRIVVHALLSWQRVGCQTCVLVFKPHALLAHVCKQLWPLDICDLPHVGTGNACFWHCQIAAAAVAPASFEGVHLGHNLPAVSGAGECLPPLHSCFLQPGRPSLKSTACMHTNN